MRRGEPLLHPALWLLAGLLVLAVVLKLQEPSRNRAQALAAARVRAGLSEIPAQVKRVVSDEDLVEEEEEETPDPDWDPEAVQVSSLPDWFTDVDFEHLGCTMDGQLHRLQRLDVHTQRLFSGTQLLLSPQDLAFLGWTAFTYQLNPHFLLGVMAAESAGDCSAVSSAGAQGCFQITYRQGAGQLKNSFPARVASWYWAARSNVGGTHRRPGEALGYFPADLYVPPAKHYGFVPKRGTRQLRMTWDPAATLLTSDRVGDTQVSSVASFSFGVIGAGLYFHFLNAYLLKHEEQLKGDVHALVGVPGLKVKWMAASYNQGSPRTMRQLGTYGPSRFLGNLSSDVRTYAETVHDYCAELQDGEKTYSGTMTWGQFSEFLQQLRWTYSEVPIDWERVRAGVQAKYFSGNRSIDLQEQVLDVFRYMQALEPRFLPEKPRIDHRVRF